MNTDLQTSGWVFNIQRFSVHDGPGIRTTVFLKGCPLRCVWCCNPESQQRSPQVVFWPDRCINCGVCLATCPEGAIDVGDDGSKRVIAELCTTCGLCVEACYAEALEMIGQSMTVQEVLKEVRADQQFYDESGGGMTLSGGEPTSQAAFSLQILKGCHDHGIHTAIETCGQASWTVWESLLPHLDLILYDLKETDPQRHKRWTGVSNNLVLDNLRRLAASNTPLIVRRPVIPGYNDDEQSIHQLGQFVRDLGTVQQIDLLPYHRMGQGKYERLGEEYAMGDQPSLQEDEVGALKEILTSYGLQVKIGG